MKPLFEKCWKVAGTAIIVQFLLRFWHQFGRGKLFWIISVWVSLQAITGIPVQPQVDIWSPYIPPLMFCGWCGICWGFSPVPFFNSLSCCFQNRPRRAGVAQGLQRSCLIERGVCVCERGVCVTDYTKVAEMKSKGFEIRDDENGVLWLCEGAKEDRRAWAMSCYWWQESKKVVRTGAGFSWSLLSGGGGNGSVVAEHCCPCAVRSHLHVDLQEHAVYSHKVSDGRHVSQLCVLWIDTSF